MKISDLIILINEVVEEEFTKAPKFGDIQPTDQKPNRRPGMMGRPFNGMDTSQQKKMLWAEDKELPEPTKSDVEMPFPVIDFPDVHMNIECTVGLKDGALRDERDVEDKIVDINLNDSNLFATQHDLHLNLDQLKSHIETQKNKLPVVVGFPNGVMLIQDGHHRLAIQKIMGQNSAKVRLLSLTNWVDLEEETEEWIKEIGPKINEVCALGGVGVVATSDGSAFESETKQKEKHEQMWSEEKLGKAGPNGPTYFQMGGSLPDALYNQKNGKPSRDPGIAGLKEHSNKELIACRSGYTHDFYPAKRGSIGPGYYFTTNPERAKKYGDGSVVWVKIKLNNPYYTTKATIGDEFGYNDYVDQDSGAYNFEIGGEINELIKSKGYDGIIAKEKNGKHVEIIVFDRNSYEPIKSPDAVQESYYHGTTVDIQPGQYILPPSDTNNVSEKGRKKNLDRVFFTQDLGSAKIYAGRAKHSLGGDPKIYLIEPEGPVDVINAQPGSTVFMAPKAKVVKRVM